MTNVSKQKLRQELFKIIEPAMYHYPDTFYIDRALDNLEALVLNPDLLAKQESE